MKTLDQILEALILRNGFKVAVGLLYVLKTRKFYQRTESADNPKSQREEIAGIKKASRRTSNVEEDFYNKIMMAIDGTGFDWSYMAQEEGSTNFTPYGLYLILEENESMLNDQIAVLKRDASYKDSYINGLEKQVERLKKEKEENQFKIDNYENASKSLEKLIANQISDNNKKGLGYNVVPPPLTGLFTPHSVDLSSSEIEKFKEPEFDRVMVLRNLSNQVNTANVISVNTVGKQGINAVKPTAYWAWRPKVKMINHVYKNTGFCVCKQFDYVDPTGRNKVLNSPYFMVKSWLVQDQTVLGQTATGKESSNPFMAGSLPKTISPMIHISQEVILLKEERTVSKDSEVCKITRADGTSSFHGDFQALLRRLDRQDLFQLYSLVQERYKHRSIEGHDLDLWGDLKMMFDPNEEDDIWLNQHYWELLRWKLHEYSGVHSLFLDGTSIQINMLVDKKYPLKKEILKKMINLKIEAEEESDMASELIKFIKSQIAEQRDDGDVMFIEIVKKNEDSRKEEPEVGGLKVEYFNIFLTQSELAYQKYLMCGPIPSIFLRNPIITGGCPSNLKVPCNIGHVHVEKAYINLNSLLNIMTRMMYNWIMRRKLDPRENSDRGISNFTGRIKGMHVFIGNFTYVKDFMIVEDISSIIDPRLSQVVLGKPFIG
ncbi:hypothetical protein Tco_0455887 [Tanacetum coccineum]